MTFRQLSPIFLVVSFCLASVPAHAETVQPANPVEVVGQMETNYGIHHGFRRNHAKGLCALGEFKATAQAKDLSRSVLFNGETYSVISRFSIAGGVPDVSDIKKIPRGMGLQFQLGKGAYHNMAMINAPIFLVSTPEAFAESLKAGTPEKLKAFQEKHPESKPFLEYFSHNNPPVSYASAAYFGLHAFKFTNAANKDQFVRWHFEPSGGVHRMTDAALAKADGNYLESEFKEHMQKGAAEWTMFATLAEPGDSLTDPTKAWPSKRKQVKMGTLKLSKYEPQADGSCNKINFDPNQVSDGVAASDDLILRFRSPTYGVSYGKRSSDPVDKK